MTLEENTAISIMRYLGQYGSRGGAYRVDALEQWYRNPAPGYARHNERGPTAGTPKAHESKGPNAAMQKGLFFCFFRR